MTSPPMRPRSKQQVVAGDTLRFDLVFRPQRPGEHSFSLPLSLEGILPDGAKRLRVPVSAVGLKPTLTFASTEVDFGRNVVSRDPCALKQHQGEFVLRNASDKVRVQGRLHVQVREWWVAQGERRGFIFPHEEAVGLYQTVVEGSLLLREEQLADRAEIALRCARANPPNANNKQHGSSCHFPLAPSHLPRVCAG